MNEFKVKINGNDYNLVVRNVEENIIDMEINGQPYSVELEKPLKTQKTTISRPVVTRSVESVVSATTAPVVKPSVGASSAAGSVKSPLPGVILDISVKVGDNVSMGQKLMVLEAMKMENTINSDKEGKVIELKVQKGDSVLEGADLIIIG